MSAYRFHAPNKLSGGQKQRIAIAGVMAMKPKCMILDEATAMLDPEGRREVLEAVHALNREEQISIILITHHMEEAVDADRVLVMDGGRVVMDGTPREIFAKPEELGTHGLKLPDATELGFMLKEAGLPLAVPVLTEGELTEQLARCMKKNQPIEAREPSEEIQGEKADLSSQEKTVETILELQDVSYTYGEDTPYMIHALEHISLRIEKGSFTGIVGHTGSGKSTLLQLLNGLLAPSAGHIYLAGQDLWPKQEEASEKKKRSKKKKPRKKQHIPELNRRVGLVFQYPEYQLFEESVLKDVCFGPRNLGLSAGEAEKRAEAALKLVGIREEQFSQSPFVLSGGQMRRVALAGILAMEPEVLILDEPTAGLDPRGRFKILELLKRLNREQHMTILLVSHSMEDIAAYADHVLVLNDGHLEYDDRTEKVFSHRKELEHMGLTVPAAARIVDTLRSNQIFCGQAFTIREAAGVISATYRAGQDLQNSAAGQAVGQRIIEDGGATC
jgi:energy-coupling factor transport system ATP-binding protein